MKKIQYVLLFLCLSILSNYSFSAQNEDEGFLKNTYNDFKYKVSDTWNNSNQKDIYIPLNTWHNRATYDKEKTDEYNENPWGLGYGKSMYDKNKNWNAIYIMAFKDSHNKWEPIGGYAWEKQWYYNDFRIGLGYTAMITARNDWLHYALPVPGVLPLVSFSYKNFSIQNTYIPGTYNNGNVWFMWARYQL